MRTRAKTAGLLVAALLGTTTAGAAAPAAGAGRTLPGTPCPVLPANSIWHADISTLPVSVDSAAWLSHMGAASRRLHPDFGPSYGAQPVPYGMPVTVVGSGHPKVAVRFTYAAESDQVAYPLGADTLIEGGPEASGDRHALVVDTGTCRLYETWNTRPTPTGWTAGSGAVFDLRSNALRPAGWTSADAAGLAILPGLLRYDEVQAGFVDHAIRFTTDVTDRSYLWPARHQAGAVSDPSYPPMGARFRMKASFPIAGYAPQTQVVLRAMRTYGLVLADNGSPWFFQGTADAAWPENLLDELKTVPAGAFEAVDVASIKVWPNSGRSKRP